MISRNLSQLLRIAVDIAVLSSAYALGYMLRFDWQPPWPMVKRLTITLPYVVLFQYGLLHAFGITRFAWRYLGLRETVRILQVLLLASLLLAAVRALVGLWAPVSPVAAAAVIPYGVVAIDFVLAFLGVTGVRVVRRITTERAARGVLKQGSQKSVPTLLIGAGHLGLLTAKEAAARPDLGIAVVGFLDDDLSKVGTQLHGAQVHGPLDELSQAIARLEVQQVLITISAAPGSRIKPVLATCRSAGVLVKVVPGMHERVGQQFSLTRVRDVAIDDLLRREPVVLDPSSIAEYTRSKVVLVTGAGGSIGAELCRKLCEFQPARLVLVDHAENSLFHCDRKLRRHYPNLDLVPCLVDVTDEARMRAVFQAHAPAVVFHAAAHKHVPLMEHNPQAAIHNNVFGTKVMADLARAHGSERFILISTDKAVNPSSVMGATKRIAELHVQALGALGGTQFSAVRFGNVLGSEGSVVPLFQEQIAQGGPVTVTHPDMQRYFMTLDEACQLVLQAAALAQGSEIFILDMGRPLHIVDLARDLIRLSGLREGTDISIVYSGIRPGEKLHEQLGVATEGAHSTRHPKIFVGKLAAVTLAELNPLLRALEVLLDPGLPAQEVIARLQELLPEYHPSKTPPLASAELSPGSSTGPERGPPLSGLSPPTPTQNSALTWAKGNP